MVARLRCPQTRCGSGIIHRVSPRHYGIQTLEDYGYWVDKTVEHRGAEFERGYLEIEEIHDDSGRRIGDLYPRQSILFPDGFTCEFDQFVDVELAVDEYHYIYRRTGGPLLTRVAQASWSRSGSRRLVPQACPSWSAARGRASDPV